MLVTSSGPSTGRTAVIGSGRSRRGSMRTTWWSWPARIAAIASTRFGGVAGSTVTTVVPAANRPRMAATVGPVMGASTSAAVRTGSGRDQRRTSASSCA